MCSCDILARRNISFVKEMSIKYDLPTYLILSVMNVESGFDSNAVSKAGAVGVMQLMPETAKWLCTLTDIKYDYKALKETNYNIELGCYYLKYLFNKFDEAWQAIAAYNAGEGVVATWIQQGINKSNIPYTETRNYILRIEKWQKYYSSKKFTTII